MSTPVGQLLPVQDLRRIQNLRSKQKSIKASKKEIAHYNQMKEEILQFMQLQKKKIKIEIKQLLKKSIKNNSLHAANDEYYPLHYSQQSTFLVD